jgi:hypothetical protein
LSEVGLRGLIEQPVRLEFPDIGAVLAGKVDVLTVTDEVVTVFECKTGRRRRRDEIQLLLYMYAVSRDASYLGHRIRGVLVYCDRQLHVESVPHGFGANVEYYMRLVAGAPEPTRVPGEDCAWCPIPARDCPDRVEARSEELL